MASGQTLAQFFQQDQVGPNTLAMQKDWVLGTSSPAELFPVLAADQTTIEYSDFRGTMPQNYAGGGLTLDFHTGCGTATGGAVLEAAFLAMKTSVDLDTTAKTYDYNTCVLGTLPTIGATRHDTLTFTNGSDMDSVVAGDPFLLRVRRKCDHASDTAAADLYIHGIDIKET